MRSLSTGAAGIALGLAIAACAVRSSAPTRQSPEYSLRQKEISDLWMQIRDWRHDAHMEVDPPQPYFQGLRGSTVRQTANAACADAHVPPPACTDVCDLADAICDNAESICSIASELEGDTWAQEKCDSAKASCKEAKQECCGCDDEAAKQAVVP
jgi:hypothetical protein